MSLQGAVTARLAAVTGVTDLVSTRIYAVKLPQNWTSPAITYQVVSRPETATAMGADPGVAAVVVQVSAWSRVPEGESGSALEAINVKEAVRAALQRFSGTLDSTEVLDVFVEGEGPELYEEDTRVFQESIDFRVWYRE